MSDDPFLQHLAGSLFGQQGLGQAQQSSGMDYFKAFQQRHDPRTDEELKRYYLELERQQQQMKQMEVRQVQRPIEPPDLRVLLLEG